MSLYQCYRYMVHVKEVVMFWCKIHDDVRLKLSMPEWSLGNLPWRHKLDSAITDKYSQMASRNDHCWHDSVYLWFLTKYCLRVLLERPEIHDQQRHYLLIPVTGCITTNNKAGTHDTTVTVIELQGRYTRHDGHGGRAPGRYTRHDGGRASSDQILQRQSVFVIKCLAS